MEQKTLQTIISKLLAKLTGYSIAVAHPEPVPIGVSNRHLHLAPPDLETLFGPNYQLQLQRDLRQPGQFAAVETVMLAGPKGCLERVRILGPVRKQTQVEISQTDAFRLGLDPPVRESGDIKGSSGVTIIGPKGTVQIKEGLIIAQRHIHMAPSDAKKYEVTDGAKVQVRLGGERGLVFDLVTVRVNSHFALEMHLDTDEANAARIGTGDSAYLLTDRLQVGTKDNAIAVKNTQKNIAEVPGLVTEDIVRRAWKDRTTLSVKEGTVITPLARDTAKELGVTIIVG